MAWGGSNVESGAMPEDRRAAGQRAIHFLMIWGADDTPMRVDLAWDCLGGPLRG